VGDPPAAFEDLFREVRPGMLRTAYLIVGSRAVAEEMVQEAFVRLYRHYEGVENPGGYLRTTLVRLCVQARDRALAEVAHAEAAFEPGPTGEPVIDTTWDCLLRLRPERRAVLVLRFYHDMTPAEIAEELGWREATVRTRLHRGLRDLRREITES
jgi:DNA-directed RNA polymerase specialized sigma24 family protein